jgi:ribosomal protein S18 acetylase RimI-like enzyme
MNLRRATAHDLPDILRLYHFLNPDDPVYDPQEEVVQKLWNEIMANDRLRYFVAETDGRVVATCTLTLIPNLTRDLKPYGVIENVVTDPELRQQGFATAVLRHALKDAWAEGCYKVMLSTGSKRESTLRFYEKAGFKRGIKTGFIAHPGDIVYP